MAFIEKKTKQVFYQFHEKNPKFMITEIYLYTMPQKLSKCEVKAAQCGNTISLPLRFYVKSNFREFKHSKNVILALLQVLNFNFDKFEQFIKSQIYQNSKFVKMAIFEIQTLPTFFSCKIE